MSMRYQAGIIQLGFNGPLAPNPPTIGTATAGGAADATITFTAPSNTGGAAITSYVAVSTPGGFVGTGTSSPIIVGGLTSGTSYTFQVYAINKYGNSLASAASNSITATLASQVQYTTAGTYTFVVPSGLNPYQISVVCVGPGSNQGTSDCGGGGGGLGYKSAFSVTAGQSFTVVVGGYNSGTDSYFSSPSFCKGGAASITGNPRTGGTYAGDGGGNGGNGGTGNGYSPQPYPTGGGGGAGGYSGNGGAGGDANTGSSGNSGSSGSGGGGGGGGSGGDSRPGQGFSCGGGGGGVGLLGAGSSGAGGSGYSYATGTCDVAAIRGIGGSGGADGGYNFGSSGGGAYGGGGSKFVGGYGGAVRIIWSLVGATRSYPSTNTGNI